MLYFFQPMPCSQLCNISYHVLTEVCPCLSALFPGFKVLRNRTRITQSLSQHGHIVFVLHEENSDFIQRQDIKSRVHWSLSCFFAGTSQTRRDNVRKTQCGHAACLQTSLRSDWTLERFEHITAHGVSVKTNRKHASTSALLFHKIK